MTCFVVVVLTGIVFLIWELCILVRFILSGLVWILKRIVKWLDMIDERYSPFVAFLIGIVIGLALLISVGSIAMFFMGK
jgi:hypothetical protein